MKRQSGETLNCFCYWGGGGAEKISVFALFGEDSKIRQSDNNDKGLIIIILALYS
jgi:hypothetical protein